MLADGLHSLVRLLESMPWAKIASVIYMCGVQASSTGFTQKQMLRQNHEFHQSV